MKKIEGDKIVPVPGGDRFGNNKINSVLPYEDNRLLIITKKEGLFISSGESFINFKTEADELFSTHIPYYGIRLSSGEYAIGTKKGVFIINRSGNLISLLDKKSGMNNDNIKILFEDKERNIWVGLNVGISKIEYSSPFRVMDSRMKLTGMVLSIKKSGNSIYVGTSTGLFRYNKNSFSKIEGVEASCWDIMDLNGKLIFASSSGLYTLEDNRFNRESSVRIYKLFRSRNYTENIWAGTVGGVSRLDIINNSIALIPVPGINTEIRSLVEDREGILWAGSPTNGVFRLVPGENGEITDLKNYYINDGLPGKETHVFLINGKAVFATAKGLYKFIESEKRFEPDDILGDEFCDGSTSIFYIHEDNSGKLWIHSANKNYSAEKNSKGTYDIDGKIFLRMPERQVNSILRNGNVIWFGTIEGIIKFDTQYEKKYLEGTHPLLRRMTINGDKIIYKGLEINEEDSESSFLFSPDCRNIKFEYSSPFYEAEDKTKFRCKLEGSGEEFSEWSDKNFKEFYNLTFGYYRFIVEARNVYGDISSSSVFQFKIEPPWYWKWWIFPFYFLLIAGSIYIIVLWRSSALLKEKKELEKTIAERTIELREKSVKLEEMDRIKSRFFANISHEFRTPLTLINGPLEDMITESNNAGEAERLRQMLNNSNKLLALINQLLDLSKLESGQMKLDRRPDDIVVFLKGIISSFEHPAKQKKILLLLSTSQEEIITSFDRNKLENVFTNLLANAIKFTEEGGKISINITVLKADNKDEKYIKIIL
ncbi:MAG: hypothetical protein KAR14_05130, partial [Candidatus Aminicenantes bacterium]|nr:hypothetical protein [Candidatus Aminicenantes bacterium]